MPVTFEQLVDETSIILKDNSPQLLDLVREKLNEALYSVADSAVSSGGIPELKRIGVFTTVIDQAWANLPDGFNGKLLFVGNDSVGLAIADGGVQQLMEINPLLDEVGPVHTVALEGNVLYYQGIPSSETNYPILYQAWPTLFTTDQEEVPSYFPPHLQRGLFIHKAASLVFNIIEDGVEGEKVNTMAQLGMHQDYLNQFLQYLGRRRTSFRNSVWSF